MKNGAKKRKGGKKKKKKKEEVLCVRACVYACMCAHVSVQHLPSPERPRGEAERGATGRRGYVNGAGIGA